MSSSYVKCDIFLVLFLVTFLFPAIYFVGHAYIYFYFVSVCLRFLVLCRCFMDSLSLSYVVYLRKPQKKFLFFVPLLLAGPLKKITFFEALKISKKNVATKLEGVGGTKKNFFCGFPKYTTYNKDKLSIKQRHNKRKRKQTDTK